MNCDPATYILAAALLGGGLGFFGCALFAASTIREIRSDSYWEGYGACNRAHAARMAGKSTDTLAEGVKPESYQDAWLGNNGPVS